MNILLTLPIDDQYRFVIVSSAQNNIDDLYPYSGEMQIFLCYNNEFLLVSTKMTLWDIDEIIEHCQKVLHQKLFIPKSIGIWQNLGINYNQYWYKVNLSINSNHTGWIGMPLRLFECGALQLRSSVTFLYNNDQNVELQITSLYPWFFTSESVPVEYQEWEKDYKIIHRFVFSINIMQHWVFLLQDFVNQLNKNLD